MPNNTFQRSLLYFISLRSRSPTIVNAKYISELWTSAMVNFQSDAMLMVHFSTAMRYRLFLEKLNIAIVAIIFLDHRERLFFDYFAHFRTDYFGLFLTCSQEVTLHLFSSITSFLMIPVSQRIIPK